MISPNLPGPADRAQTTNYPSGVIATKSPEQMSGNSANTSPFGGAQNPADDPQQKMFQYAAAEQQLRYLVQDWTTIVDESQIARNQRYANVDREALRQVGELDQDETFIPKRIINSNIERELPPYINYLKNSRRVALFTSTKKPQPQASVDRLEQEFTRVCTYTAWEQPHYKCCDGSELHGWDAVEVIYDDKKPGAFSIEQIGHDKFYFPRSATDLQACPRVARAYDVTFTQLQVFVAKYNFDPQQVAILMEKRRDNSKENETIRIFKLFMKVAGIVYVSWFTLQEGANDWLKKPELYYNGIHDINVEGMPAKRLDYYPIFILPYRLTEEAIIISARGRAFFDEPEQEAMSALWSGYVNQSTRASQTMASLETDDGTGAPLKELENVKLRGGVIMSRAIKFFSHPSPDENVLKTLQYSDNKNAQENGQVNFAAMNREDSRKTAKEISSAEKAQGMLNSVQLTLFSTYLRQVYSYVWLIVQSQALLNKIVFLQVEKVQPVINSLVGAPVPDPQTGQPMTNIIYLNDADVIRGDYDLRAAGDTDVIAKEETVAKMQQDMPLVMQTPLKDVFLADYFKLRYSETGDRYANILQTQGSQFEQMKGMLGQLATMLEGVLQDHPEDMQQLPQQQVQDMVNVITQAKQIAGAGDQVKQARMAMAQNANNNQQQAAA